MHKKRKKEYEEFILWKVKQASKEVGINHLKL